MIKLKEFLELKVLFLFFLRSSYGKRSTTSANGCVLIFVYMTYTMLPVRLREALFGGLLLSIMHVYLSATCSHHVNWSEVILIKIQLKFIGMYLMSPANYIKFAKANVKMRMHQNPKTSISLKQFLADVIRIHIKHIKWDSILWC